MCALCVYTTNPKRGRDQRNVIRDKESTKQQEINQVSSQRDAIHCEMNTANGRNTYNLAEEQNGEYRDSPDWNDGKRYAGQRSRAKWSYSDVANDRKCMWKKRNENK